MDNPKSLFNTNTKAVSYTHLAVPLDVYLFFSIPQISFKIYVAEWKNAYTACACLLYTSSPFINSFPEKLISTFPFGIGEVINESCFSAVTPLQY